MTGSLIFFCFDEWNNFDIICELPQALSFLMSHVTTSDNNESLSADILKKGEKLHIYTTFGFLSFMPGR